MANTKISALTAGAPAQSTDVVPIDRAGANFSLQVSDILGGGAPANVVTAAAALTANQLVVGSGSKAEAALGAAGTTTQVLHGNASGTPSFGAVALATDVSGILPLANGGTSAAKGPGYGLLSGLINVSYDRFFAGNAGSGDVSLYTVPANKRALIQLEAFNTAGTTTTWTPEVQINGAGSFFKLVPAISTVTLTQSAGTNIGMVLEAGDIFAINTSQAGLNVFGSVILFDNTSALKSPRIASSSWTNGSNIIYTAPSNALLAGFSPFFNSSSSSPLNYVNQSGSAATIFWSLVESGGSVGATNKLANNNNATVANNATAGGATNFYLNTGDELVLNTNQTAQQLAWVTVWEGV